MKHEKTYKTGREKYGVYPKKRWIKKRVSKFNSWKAQYDTYKIKMVELQQKLDEET